MQLPWHVILQDSNEERKSKADIGDGPSEGIILGDEPAHHGSVLSRMRRHVSRVTGLRESSMNIPRFEIATREKAINGAPTLGLLNDLPSTA